MVVTVMPPQQSYGADLRYTLRSRAWGTTTIGCSFKVRLPAQAPADLRRLSKPPPAACMPPPEGCVPLSDTCPCWRALPAVGSVSVRHHPPSLCVQIERCTLLLRNGNLVALEPFTGVGSQVRPVPPACVILKWKPALTLKSACLCALMRLLPASEGLSAGPAPGSHHHLLWGMGPSSKRPGFVRALRSWPALGIRPSPLLPLQLEPTFVPTHHERSMNTRGQVSSHERRQRNVKVIPTPL